MYNFSDDIKKCSRFYSFISTQSPLLIPERLKISTLNKSWWFFSFTKSFSILVYRTKTEEAWLSICKDSPGWWGWMNKSQPLLVVFWYSCGNSTGQVEKRLQNFPRTPLVWLTTMTIPYCRFCFYLIHTSIVSRRSKAVICMPVW